MIFSPRKKKIRRHSNSPERGGGGGKRKKSTRSFGPLQSPFCAKRVRADACKPGIDSIFKWSSYVSGLVPLPASAPVSVLSGFLNLEERQLLLAVVRLPGVKFLELQ